ncbi:efflux RND transporter permease subunit [Aquabacterium sp.]|uniref:efflux RND transporter permease subunit n=1 Tax=Aquabacterium sp. TaxID=1872578 RepID=UPI0025BCE079|nr:efflux RND transporter permease subunit [Aquabacterium sp.]
MLSIPDEDTIESVTPGSAVQPDPVVAPSERLIARVADGIFRMRKLWLTLGILVTVLLGLSATRLHVTAGFTKMIPLHHEFMQTFTKYQSDFGGADKVLIAVKVRQGDVFSKDGIDAVRKITDELFYIKGIERSSLTSLVTPNVRWNEVVEEGFKGGPIVSADFKGAPDQLSAIRQNLAKSDWGGRIVSNDGSATIVSATLQDRDPETGERLDLRQVGAQLEDIRSRYENSKMSVHIVGFAKSSADIAQGASGVIKFFALAFVVTAVMLYWYSGSAMLTYWVLLAAAIPVVWLMGILPLLGMGLDPMSILVPFLIFAIGVSHAVQMTNAWKLETLAGQDGITASRNCFVNLFIPGATALLANAVGFIVIAIVDIEIVRELALTATIGVTVMIATNKVLLPILLSYMKLSPSRAKKLEGKETAGDWFWERLGFLATRRGAMLPLSLSVALTAFGLYEVRDLKIGDLGTGVPELRADTRYNQDVQVVTSHFAIGLDVLQVIAELEGDASPCLNREVLAKVEAFESDMRQTEGVAAVRGMASFIGKVTQDFSEGWVKWRVLPETREQIAQATGFASRLGNEFRNTQCNAIPISVFPIDHQATTIRRIVDKVQAFKKTHDGQGITFRLASGNIGVMAATNEVVEQSDKWVNLTLFAAVSLLCLVTFRSVRITLCVILPLALVTLLCNAIMAMLSIGVKVNTLPVIAISVGVGVDYGIYLFERMRHEMAHSGMNLRDAFVASLKQRGTASIFTAAMMTISVITWTFSTLKFQADMGVLLAFMFLVNVFGAIFLLPGLAAWIVPDRLPAKG